MTFHKIYHRVLTRWWFLPVFTLLFALLFFPWSTEKVYLAEIQIGANFNNSALINVSDQTITSGYVDSLDRFSVYLENRFRSVLVQQDLARRVNLQLEKTRLDLPFYEVKRQGMGFLLIQYQTKSEDQARLFLEEVKKVYTDKIIPEWNESRQEVFKITPMQNFQTTVAELSKPKQLLLLPSAIGFLFGLLLALWLPDLPNNLSNKFGKKVSKKSISSANKQSSKE